MMSSLVYARVSTVDDHTEGTYCATVTSYGDNRIKLHIRLSKYVEVPLSDSFLDTLRSFTNQKMWDFMYPDGDGEWKTEQLLNGTLDIAHDSSHQPEITKEVCSTAV